MCSIPVLRQRAPLLRAGAGGLGVVNWHVIVRESSTRGGEESFRLLGEEIPQPNPLSYFERPKATVTTCHPRFVSIYIIRAQRHEGRSPTTPRHLEWDLIKDGASHGVQISYCISHGPLSAQGDAAFPLQVSSPLDVLPTAEVRSTLSRAYRAPQCRMLTMTDGIEAVSSRGKETQAGGRPVTYLILVQ